MKPLNGKMWVEFKGKKNDEIGAYLISMPQRQHPAMQGDRITIKGKDGFMFVSNSQYPAITVKVDFVVPDNTSLRSVRRWLNGSGKLRFSDFPDHYYEAYILNSMTMTSPHARLQGQKLTATFTCQPFRKSITEDTTDVFVASKGISNGHGDVYSMPLLECSGSGSPVLTVNGDQMQLTLTEGQTVYVDCDARVAYTISSAGATEFAGSKIKILDGSNWISLNPESDDESEWNNINWTGDLTVKVHPRWRWF